MNQTFGSLDMAALEAAVNGTVMEKVNGLWVAVPKTPSVPVLPFAGPFSGPGPHLLTLNAYNLYDNSAGDALVMNIPNSPSDGDEIWLINVAPSRNPVTLSGQTKNISEWYKFLVQGTSITIAMEAVLVGFKFSGPFNIWVRLVADFGVQWGGVDPFGTGRLEGPGTFTLFPQQDAQYNGATTLTVKLPLDPLDGQTAMLAETTGSGVGMLTIDANGQDLVNDAAASAPTMTVNSAYATRGFKFSDSDAIWLRTSTVN